MKKQLGVEMTILDSNNRRNLMKGTILRRIDNGRPLDEQQLQLALDQDFIELKKRFRTFDFENYVGSTTTAFLSSMVVGTLISQRDYQGKVLYERGPMADEFLQGLSEDMRYMIEDMPMSMRGVFDDLKVDPERSVTINADELFDQKDKQVIVDDRRNNDGRQPKQTNAGPIILPP